MIDNLIKLANYLDKSGFEKEADSVDSLIKLSQGTSCEQLWADANSLKAKITRRRGEINRHPLGSDRRNALIGTTNDPARGTLNYMVQEYAKIKLNYETNCEDFSGTESTGHGGRGRGRGRRRTRPISRCQTLIGQSNSLQEAYNNAVDAHDECVAGVKREFPGQPYNDKSDPVFRCQEQQAAVDAALGPAEEAEKVAKRYCRTHPGEYRSVRWNVPPE